MYVVINFVLRIFAKYKIKLIQIGINLTEEQWDFIVKHMNDINAQIKTMKH